MHCSGPIAFLNALGNPEQRRLFELSSQAVAPAPDHYLHWYCADNLLGLLSPGRASWLTQQLTPCRLTSEGLVWDAAHATRAQRSEQLQNALLQARAQGLLPGWRNERFSFWHADCTTPDPDVPALLNVERSGFRFLGMLSHAVHVNGFLPDGRLWCARRALTKATDPGMLDNVTAGGLPSGETVQDCLQRELAEEAGLFNLQGHLLQPAGQVRTSRLEREGWHDEILHVFNLTLPDGFAPHNQDGEVAEFMCLRPGEVLARTEAGEFTVDAVQTLIQGLRANSAHVV
jgi:8-oxo-dGTP pyrophosphatase MutT (NUDIX family)